VKRSRAKVTACNDPKTLFFLVQLQFDALAVVECNDMQDVRKTRRDNCIISNWPNIPSTPHSTWISQTTRRRVTGRHTRWTNTMSITVQWTSCQSRSCSSCSTSSSSWLVLLVSRALQSETTRVTLQFFYDSNKSLNKCLQTSGVEITRQVFTKFASDKLLYTICEKDVTR